MQKRTQKEKRDSCIGFGVEFITPHKDRYFSILGVWEHHAWEYTQACTGNRHYFGRKCRVCQKHEATGARRCGKACPVYRERHTGIYE